MTERHFKTNPLYKISVIYVKFVYPLFNYTRYQ